MKIAIVEDHEALKQTLKTYLARLPFDLEIVFEADSVTAAYNGFLKHKVDLAILDVEIKEGLIFDALNQLPQLNFEILFLSAHGNYAVNAFEYNALNYILKPLEYAALEKQFFQYYNRQKESTTYLKQQIAELEHILRNRKVEKIALPSATGVAFYRFTEISWIKADSNYCHFVLKTGKKVVVSKPLKEFVNLLEHQGFYRIHKSYMVNLSFVQQYIKGDGGYVILEDGSEIQVSRRKKEGLLIALQVNS